MAPVADEEPVRGPQLLGSTSFFRLWLAQVVSSLGDWIGLVAVLSITNRVGGSSPEAAIALVMSARMIPGFFLASIGGVLVDRWDRKKVMVTCDVGRAMVLATLPFVDSVWGLFLVSLFLEILTLLWSPAKEASVPNLVSVGQAVQRQLVLAGRRLRHVPHRLGPVRLPHQGVGVRRRRTPAPSASSSSTRSRWPSTSTCCTFLTSAFIISTLTIPRHRARRKSPSVKPLSGAITEIREGWRFIGTNPVVRAVMVGLGTGLIGGGMVAPLGPRYSSVVLNAGPSGFGLMLTALGMGLAVGVLGLTTLQRRLSRLRIFPLAVLGAGASHVRGVVDVEPHPHPALHRRDGGVRGRRLRPRVHDPAGERGGRAAGPDLRHAVHAVAAVPADLAGRWPPCWPGCSTGCRTTSSAARSPSFGATVSLPGVRLTLWIGAAIILVAGVLALRTLKSEPDQSEASTE